MTGLLPVCSLWSLCPECAAQQPVAPITALAVSPQGNAVMVGSQAGIRIRDLPALEPGGELPTTMAHVHDLVFSPDGDSLVAVGGSPAEFGQIELFSWPQKELLWRRTWGSDLIYAASFSPTQQKLITGDGDRHVTIWDLSTREPTVRLDGHFGRVTAVAFLSDHVAVSGGADHSLRVWNTTSAESDRVLDNHRGAIHDLAVCPRPGLSRPLIATVAADQTVRFWQPSIGRMVRFARIDSEPLAVCWTAAGTHVVVGCADGRLRVIDADLATVGRTVNVSESPLFALARAPDARRILVGSGVAEQPVLNVLLEPE